jgi:hypothetical protein
MAGISEKVVIRVSIIYGIIHTPLHRRFCALGSPS